MCQRQERCLSLSRSHSDLHFKLCDPAQMEARRALARCALRALGPRLRGRRGLGLSF
ncbi:hypothetical protein AYM02_10270 [Coxiella burnetii]|nr:hypothetical protein [Coxiella burnetii]AML49655.1 hypothetical protein AUR58_11150 [Coxiella burnetii]AML55558.1 hypothetical protein AYM38_10120 [Coxiella burnetii]ATN69538.1 hypothetical protein AYM00_10630 [Coxiella burnetii]ATN71459.1 hypothetical protein AYM02_10270 [Coxiella burnetii]ATN73352.1 hypothetical protein AYM11_09945 [Coxiella burnetii]